jgi:hypothetical protein
MTTTRWAEGRRDVLRRPLIVYAGLALVALGLLAIILGWYGAGGEKLVERQIPYLISGAFGGAGLVGLGTLLLFSNDMRLLRQRVDDLHAVLHELDGEVVQRVDHLLARVETDANGAKRDVRRAKR